MSDPDTPYRVAAAVCKIAVGFRPARDGCDWRPEKVWPLPNVWLGVSVENRAAQSRIHALRETPAAVRFISFEPLLEELEPGLAGIDWVIVGGESGNGARPCEIDWIGRIIYLCRGLGVPCFVKQLGARPYYGAPKVSGVAYDRYLETTGQEYDPEPEWLNLRDSHGGDPNEWPPMFRVREFPAVRT